MENDFFKNFEYFCSSRRFVTISFCKVHLEAQKKNKNENKIQTHTWSIASWMSMLFFCSSEFKLWLEKSCETLFCGLSGTKRDSSISSLRWFCSDSVWLRNALVCDWLSCCIMLVLLNMCCCCCCCCCDCCCCVCGVPGLLLVFEELVALPCIIIIINKTEEKKLLYDYSFFFCLF